MRLASINNFQKGSPGETPSRWQLFETEGHSEAIDTVLGTTVPLAVLQEKSWLPSLSCAQVTRKVRNQIGISQSIQVLVKIYNKNLL